MFTEQRKQKKDNERQVMLSLKQLRRIVMKQKAIRCVERRTKTDYDVKFIKDFLENFEDFWNLMLNFKKETIKKMIKNLQYKQYRINTVMFKKGDIPDNFYIIINGSINLIDYDFDINSNTYTEVSVRKLKKGNFMGELAFTDMQPRSLTAQTSSENTEVFYLTAENFIDILQSEFQKLQNMKKETTKKYIPEINSVSIKQQTKITQMLQLRHYYRNQKIIQSNMPSDAINIIYYGNVQLQKTIYQKVPQPMYIKKFIAHLCEGSMFGYETAIYKQKCKYDAIALTECLILIIKNNDVQYLHETIIEGIKKQLSITKMIRKQTKSHLISLDKISTTQDKFEKFDARYDMGLKNSCKSARNRIIENLKHKSLEHEQVQNTYRLPIIKKILTQ